MKMTTALAIAGFAAAVVAHDAYAEPLPLDDAALDAVTAAGTFTVLRPDLSVFGTFTWTGVERPTFTVGEGFASGELSASGECSPCVEPQTFSGISLRFVSGEP